MDERVPPPAAAIPEKIKAAARALRRADRSINTKKTREHLVAEFGPAGDVSTATLRRIWADADLRHQAREERSSPPGEEVVHFNGGGGLALIAAAENELGVTPKLSRAALAAGEEHAEAQDDVARPPIGGELRNDRGQFTASYNHALREGVDAGDADARWNSDSQKRCERDLRSLATLDLHPTTLASKLLSMAVLPLLTERRGFAGLAGPSGDWLGLLGGVAYMPATLQKALAELSLLDVGESLWNTHAAQWHEVSQRWSGEDGAAWKQAVAYVDATQDPYWTRHYAASGKVSRVGRVMPCLTRIALTAGPGVPLLVETYAGSASMKKRLLPMLERLDEQLGKHEVGRLTVVDSEAGNAGLLWALDQDSRRFITVIKGNVLVGATFSEHGEWLPYRERDEVREMKVLLRGNGAPKEGVEFRAVEMRRRGGRNPKSTHLVTNGDRDFLPTDQVATAYLSRWPHQEQLFRTARNGGGLERSHGYGGEHVTHVALETKLEKADRSVKHAQKRLFKAENRLDDIAAEAVSNSDRPSPAGAQATLLATKSHLDAEKALNRARDKQAKLRSTSKTIYVRDTSRDSIMTCLNLTAIMLVEFVLKEYFGNAKMEWRTFIEDFNQLPVTVRTSRTRVLYQIHANPRSPRKMELLEAACDAINERRLRRGKRALRYEMLTQETEGS